MNKIEQASPSSKRFVVDVQTLLGLPNSTRNPHLWYQPTTMPKVAAAIARDLASIEPAHRQAFDANLRAFDASLEPWYRAIDRLRSQDRGARAATTEPVGDYLLDAAGITISTPWALQADIMNGVDPAPQAVTVEDQLLSRHDVKVFVYNEQVTDSVTASFLALARRSGVPVVGVYETMPTPGYDYQSWMLAETTALERALAHKTSTARL
jgi:zinc/manganese transport system substrate-binding protein